MSRIRKPKSRRLRLGFLRLLFQTLFGLLAAVVLLELFLRFGAVLFFLEEEKTNRLSLANRDAYVILCLGESMTAGGGLSSYPRQLEAILNNIGLDLPIAVVNRGIPSGNSGMIVAQLNENLNAYRPDMVIVMMGVLDILQPIDLKMRPGDKRGMLFLKNLRVYDLVGDAGRNIASAFSGNKSSVSKMPARQSVNPAHAVDAYREERANFFLQQGDHHFDADTDIENNRAQAILMYQRALALNPELPEAHLRMGISYRELGKHQEAMVAFRKAIRYPEVAHQALIEMGNSFRLQGDWKEARQFYETALREKPGDSTPYLELSRMAQQQYDWAAAAESLVKGLALEPFNHLIYKEFERLVAQQDTTGDFERILETARIDNPSSSNFAMLEAGMLEAQDRLAEAGRLYQEIIEKHPDAFWAHTAFGNLLKRQGDQDKADFHYQEADRWSRRNTGTAGNYRRLAESVLSRAIKLVCVQYPLADIGELKDMLTGFDRITLVDNEQVFRQAVEKHSYQYYFYHKFTGLRFGHCNARGNRLLAENIAVNLVQGPLKAVASSALALVPGELDDSISGRVNLLTNNKVKVTAFSFTTAGDIHDRLIEKDTENGKRRFLERFGESTRIRVDFGADNPRTVTAIASDHPSDPDHLAMGKDYFEGASLYGSNDGTSWTLVSPDQHREYPGEDSWRLCSFPNSTPFRYYELVLPPSEFAGQENYFRRVNELAFFE